MNARLPHLYPAGTKAARRERLAEYGSYAHEDASELVLVLWLFALALAAALAFYVAATL